MSRLELTKLQRNGGIESLVLPDCSVSQNVTNYRLSSTCQNKLKQRNGFSPTRLKETICRLLVALLSRLYIFITDLAYCIVLCSMKASAWVLTSYIFANCPFLLSDQFAESAPHFSFQSYVPSTAYNSPFLSVGTAVQCIWKFQVTSVIVQVTSTPGRLS